MPDFESFKKIARLARDCIITEKLDGTNAQVYITDDGDMFIGSRNRWITPTDDNYGFARWCEGNKVELLNLGPGRHYGEWWGCGIQRGYGLKGKRFSLFNTTRWCLHGQTPAVISNNFYTSTIKYQEPLPVCVGLVPVLSKGPFNTEIINKVLHDLEDHGSVAAAGFMNPEGIIVYHIAADVMFKRTIKDDNSPKSTV